MYIRAVKIRNFKNLVNNAFEFDKNINTIIGENGTGKTNLFQAIRLALDNQFRLYLNEELFSNKIVDQKGHWLIISVEFAEVGNTVEEVHLKPDDDGKGIFTFIYRPKKDIRTQLYLKSKAINDLTDLEQKEKQVQDLINFMNKIDYRDDYEVKKTVTTMFDFNDEIMYKKIVGDFNLYDFPHPDEQDNKSLIGNPDQNFSSYINVTFIPAIRNVTSELTGENNFLTRILSNLVEDITDEDWVNFEDHIMSINDEIGDIKQFTDFVKNVDVITNKTVGNVYATNVELKMELPDKRKNLIKFFNLKGKEELSSLSLYNRSLGDNNIIYFALKLVESTMKFGHSEKVFKLMLIEEPEAHIHKFLQESLFSGLRTNTDYQLFLSTHSVHISEASRISSMTILDKIKGAIVAYKPDNNLNEQEIEYLERYLDATKTSILFSKNVCIVEGTAEIIMIPKLYELIYNFQFSSLGLSIHSIDSSFFEGISKLFHKDRVQKYTSLITDGDKDFNSPESNKEKNAQKSKRQLMDV